MGITLSQRHPRESEGPEVAHARSRKNSAVPANEQKSRALPGFFVLLKDQPFSP